MIAAAAPRVDWTSIAPVVTLFATAIVIILFVAIARNRVRTYEPALFTAVVGLGLTAFFLSRQWSAVIDDGPADALAHMVALDGFSVFVGLVVVIAAVLMLGLSADYLVDDENHLLEVAGRSRRADFSSAWENRRTRLSDKHADSYYLCVAEFETPRCRLAFSNREMETT